MDDDTIPTTTALEKLTIKVPGLEIGGFYVVMLGWKDGCAAVMNTPDSNKGLEFRNGKGNGKTTRTCFICFYFVPVRNGIKEVGLSH